MAETAPPPQLVHDVPSDTDAPPSARPTWTRREPLWRHLVGERLRQLRHERGETLDRTARRAGISPQYLSEIERGVKEPSSEMIAAIAGALDITLVDLVSAVADRLATVQGAWGQPTCRAAFALAA
ncbi:helix-turn-helix domain-containing protein [Promicromonospora kroppenstedtii]|uniref:helix-turn-helix domain-containing protein n=1 Tax=Promicromonospora kroppenstedtii TaxID=440482 RepID=UPI0004BC0A40|nr:helix-turn-helix transcriptional regulator [Promicromonospora kroppenstedtii]